MTGHIGRREFITLLGGAAAAWPIAVRARQPQPMPVIGVLTSRASAAFRQGPKDTGFIEGQNVRIEYRFAGNQNERLPALAATTAIPIVVELAANPVQLDLVASLNRPGGNVTGVTHLNTEVAPKRLELLHELVPTTSTIAHLSMRKLAAKQSGLDANAPA